MVELVYDDDELKVLLQKRRFESLKKVWVNNIRTTTKVSTTTDGENYFLVSTGVIF